MAIQDLRNGNNAMSEPASAATIALQDATGRGNLISLIRSISSARWTRRNFVFFAAAINVIASLRALLSLESDLGEQLNYIARKVVFIDHVNVSDKSADTIRSSGNWSLASSSGNIFSGSNTRATGGYGADKDKNTLLRQMVMDVKKNDRFHNSNATKVKLHPFNTSEYHNQSISGKSIPGPFYNNKLYLLGARLTTSYQNADSSVHVDFFGLPGDWWTRKWYANSSGPRCLADPHNYQSTVVHYLDIKNGKGVANLYCQVQCELEGHDNGKDIVHRQNDGEYDRPCGPKIPLELIPLMSGDSNQRDTTFIWRCNVSQHVTKGDLKHYATDSSVNGRDRAIRVYLWATTAANSTTATNQTFFEEEVAQFDIPLSTGVVGHGGPQIRSTSMTRKVVAQSIASRNNYFTQPNVKAALCVKSYGRKAEAYLPEFIQHHVNVGFGQVVVGILDASIGSPEMANVKKLLQPFIDQGTAVVAAMGLPEFRCDYDILQLHFYHACLYHNKGIAEYSAVFDVDEYWIPPQGHLDMIGTHNFTFAMQGHRQRRSLESVNFTDSREKNETRQTDNLLLSPNLASEALRIKNTYGISPSIVDVLEAIENFYAHKGCSDAWCYHLFPSYNVYLLPNIVSNQVNRTNRIGHDFYQRENVTTAVWQKSIAKTNYVFMGGIHLHGSCKFINNEQNGDISASRRLRNTYFRFAEKNNCYPHRFHPDVYGSMHHFFSLVRTRKHYGNDDWPVDEYVALYAGIVGKQLDVLDNSAVVVDNVV